MAREHRMLLFGRGEEVLGGQTAWGGTAKAKGGFSRERIEAELKNGGRMPVWQVLRCRVRYFTEGGVLGSRAFVDGFFERERSRFGEKRESERRDDRWRVGWSDGSTGSGSEGVNTQTKRANGVHVRDREKKGRRIIVDTLTSRKQPHLQTYLNGLSTRLQSGRSSL
ncbi:MAG: hypothetical protein R3F19_19565 [Verrucomicrobiales bacterium]